MPYDFGLLSPKAAVIRTRQNVGRMHELLQQAYSQKAIAPGSEISSRDLWSVIAASGEEWFNRNGDRADENGPIRAIGDLLGGHGLGLRKKSPGRYIAPTKLPEVDGDSVIKEAEY